MQLTNTIAIAASDLGHFILIFVVVYIAYAQAFFVTFGMDIEAYSSFFTSMFSLYLIILGEVCRPLSRHSQPPPRGIARAQSRGLEERKHRLTASRASICHLRSSISGRCEPSTP